MRRFGRTGSSNRYWTRGKVYEFDENNTAQDDAGKLARVDSRMLKATRWWEELKEAVVPELRHYRRMGDSTKDYTQGFVYRWVDGKMLGNAGVYKVVPENLVRRTKYWKEIEAGRFEQKIGTFAGDITVRGMRSNTEAWPKTLQSEAHLLDAGSYLQEFYNRRLVLQQPTGDRKMRNIKQVTQIDGMNSDDFSKGDLIRMIQEDEAEIKVLREVTVQSKAINKMVAELLTGIDKMVKLLDARKD